MVLDIKAVGGTTARGNAQRLELALPPGLAPIAKMLAEVEAGSLSPSSVLIRVHPWLRESALGRPGRDPQRTDHGWTRMNTD